MATKTRKTVLGNSLRQVKLDGDEGVWLRLLPMLPRPPSQSYGFRYGRDPEDRIAAARSPPMGCDAMRKVEAVPVAAKQAIRQRGRSGGQVPGDEMILF